MQGKGTTAIFSISLAIFLMLGVFSSVSPSAMWEGDNDKRSVVPEVPDYIIRAPIRINSNGNFNAAHGVTNAATGDGSPGNPWIIEGWEIDGSGYGYCIYVGNTTDYFQIKNCYLHNSTGFYSFPYFPECGIVTQSASNGFFYNNTLPYHDRGIMVRNSDNFNITYNNASHNSIYGIQNLMSTNVNISYNNVTSNQYGINGWITDSPDNVIMGNTVIDNTDSGIYLYDSDKNEIYNNLVSSNWYGLHISGVQGSQDNTIYQNDFIKNTGYGVRILRDDGNTIYHNTFIDNAGQGFDWDNNFWDNGYPSGGNYWNDYAGQDIFSGPSQDEPGSDWIGDVPYPIDFGPNPDNYPLMTEWYYPQPVLNISKYAPETALPGEMITYWLNITNLGTDWAYNVILTEYYPPGTIFVDAIPLPDVPNNVWLFGPIAPGSSFSIEITVMVDMAVPWGTWLVNNATLNYTNATGTPLVDWAEARTYVGMIYDIDLQTDWNLISVPLPQVDTSIQSVLYSIDGQWDVAQSYEGLNDAWRSYYTFKPPGLNDLLDINHTIGIWLHAINSVTLRVYGLPPTTANIPLFAGWNFVGYPSLTEKNISEALAGTGYDRPVEGFNATAPYRISPLADTYMMKPGEGYWVHVPADTVWVVDW